MKFAAATILALVSLATAKKHKHSECGYEAHHEHKHHSSSVAASTHTISVSSVGGIETQSSAALSSASSSIAIATSTRSTIHVTSTVTASATSNIAIASSPHSTVTVKSTVTASSAATSSTVVVKPSSSTVIVKPASSTLKVTSPSKASTASAPANTFVSTPGTKRGLGFNDVSATTPFSGAVSWAYNWDSQHSGSLAGGAEFVPMLWGTGSDHTSQWAKNAQAAINAGATHLLGFNEPDLSSQSNLSPQAAADAWRKYMEPFAGKAKLVSPAITNGAPPMGTGWMDAFLDACDDCTIDAIAIHIYDSASNEGYFKNYISSIGPKYNKKVWVTEFGASGSVAAQSAFLKDMVPFLNNLASVERFAYFGDFEGTFVQNGKLLPLGQAYASA